MTSKTHEMRLNADPFTAIRDGYKTIELRLYDEKRQKLSPGDTIIFSCDEFPGETISKRIEDLRIFDDFHELYSSLPLLSCGYTPFELLTADPSDMEEYYSKDLQKKFHVVGIILEEKPLQRYLAGQSGAIPNCSGYDAALSEIKSGFKSTHWIWYVFPQLNGLTADPVTEYYALNGRAEAESFLAHPILGSRLCEITNELNQLKTDDPVSIFGMVDSIKLRACMTLFDAVSPNSGVFDKALDKFCREGRYDEKTLGLL